MYNERVGRAWYISKDDTKGDLATTSVATVSSGLSYLTWMARRLNLPLSYFQIHLLTVFQTSSGVCNGCSLYQECSSTRWPHGSLPHLLSIIAQVSPSQWGLPWAPYLKLQFLPHIPIPSPSSSASGIPDCPFCCLMSSAAVVFKLYVCRLASGSVEGEETGRLNRQGLVFQHLF